MYVATVGGTADAITLTPSPAITAYAAGQRFVFIASGANTGATTVNVNSVGSRSITKNGTTALAAGDIPSGALVSIIYDGTRFQLHERITNTSLLAALGSANTFTAGPQTISGASALLEFNETDAAANNRLWGLNVNSETFYANVLNDARSAEANWLVVNRTANTIDSIALTSDAFTWGGFNVGFREIPQNAQAGNYTCVLADNGKHIYHASGDGAGDTYTIPANASVAYPIGATLTFINADSNAVSIAITTDTMTLAGTTTTGTRTLAQNGVATAIKHTSTSWIISGQGLT